MWTVNRERPSFWCFLFHRNWWFSNDWGTWWTSGRTFFEVKCTKCGGCWSEPHPVRRAAKEKKA